MASEIEKAPSVAQSAELAEQQGDARAQFEAWAVSIGARIDTDEHGNYLSSALNYSKFGWDAALAARQPGAQDPVEMSPDFTDSARGAIAWVLWHHQGGSSPIGQPLRHALGMGSDQRLSQSQIEEAKRFALWAGATTNDFHRHKPAQGIDLGQVREIRIPARNNLDPISVFVQDQAVGRGRIVVTCYGNAWQAFWGAMGDRAVVEFVAQCDADYVAGNMISGRQTRMTKAERAYTERIAAEVIAEFRTLIDQRDAAPGVGNG